MELRCRHLEQRAIQLEDGAVDVVAGLVDLPAGVIDVAVDRIDLAAELGDLELARAGSAQEICICMVHGAHHAVTRIRLPQMARPSVSTISAGGTLVMARPSVSRAPA